MEKLVVAKVNIPNPGMLRQIGDQLKDKLKSGIGVLFADAGGKVSILTIVTKDITQQYHAGKIIGKVAELVGGKGGGRPDMAMAGGKDVEKIQAAMKKVKDIIVSQNQDQQDKVDVQDLKVKPMEKIRIKINRIST